MKRKAFMAFVLALLLLPLAAAAEEDEPPELLIEIEAANGQSKTIDYVDAPGEDDFLAVLTSRFGERTNNTSHYNVAVQVNEDFIVTQVANQAPAPNVPPAWQDSPNLEIPENGFVLLAVDDAYATKGYKKFAAENFHVGDRVALKINGTAVSLDEFKALTEHIAQPSTLVLDHPAMFTLPKDQESVVISGKLSNFTDNGEYRIFIQGQAVSIDPSGAFSRQVPLLPKTNYITIEVHRGELIQNTEHLIIYRYMAEQSGKEVYLWIEQSTNLNKFTTSDSIRRLLVQAKNAGVTGVLFPVKGHEGFLSYLKNDLSGLPHISQITEPTKRGVPEDLDVLQEFINHGHDLGLRIDAVFNLYGMGSAMDTALTPEQFASMQEWVYRPEDGGSIVPISESNYKPTVYFLNPANEEAQQLQMRVIEEVHRLYDVDGIVLDRARYDNLYADFSDISRQQFEAFLAKDGKVLQRWPQDIFEHIYDESGNFVETVYGPLFYDWLTYRSTVSKTFYQDLRKQIDRVNAETGKNVPFALSMGAWYASYYEIGQNWASPDVPYDERLNLPLPDLYTGPYAETAFGTPEIVDYLILGTYYNTPQAINAGITLIHTLTEERIPVYAGMNLSSLPNPEDQRMAFQDALRFTNGIKLFDLSFINWDIVKAALEDRPYVKPYQLGISLPDASLLPEHLAPYVANGFIEGDLHNQNRSPDTVVAYTDTYGETTGTPGNYGVEVIVGADGKVIDVVNKQQAMNWQWAGRQANNSIIPRGGYVLSALDRDGVRVRRQLLAYAYSAGDDVRAALLRGHLDYDGKTVYEPELVITGNVEVLGTGAAAVKLNGIPAQVDPYGDFAGTVSLTPGENIITITVEVDGRKTNETQVAVTLAEPMVTDLAWLIEDATLYEGEQYNTVVAAVYSDGSTKPLMNFPIFSSDPSIIGVSETGTVTALQPGVSVLTAVYGDLAAEQPFTVIALRDVTIEPKNISLIVGESRPLRVVALYEDGTVLRVRHAAFSSSHEQVAEVTPYGTVTALKPGNATIRIEFAGRILELKVNVFHHDVPGIGRGRGN